MSAAILERMGRKRKTETPTTGKADGKTETVRVTADLAQMLTVISIRRKVSVSDLLSPQIREWVEALYVEVVEEMHRERPQKG